MTPLFSKRNQPRWDAAMEQWYPPDPYGEPDPEDYQPKPKQEDVGPPDWDVPQESEQDLPF